MRTLTSSRTINIIIHYAFYQTRAIMGQQTAAKNEV